jgi:hypothetical protein
MFSLMKRIFTILQSITKMYFLIPHHCIKVSISIIVICLLILVELYSGFILTNFISSNLHTTNVSLHKELREMRNQHANHPLLRIELKEDKKQ